MRQRSALEHHPELAQLWTLHFGGRVALRLLEHSSLFGSPLLVRPAVEDLRRCITELLGAIERYKGLVEHEYDELRIRIPMSWSAEQADAVFTFLSSMADKVWEANEAKLVEIARTEQLEAWTDAE